MGIFINEEGGYTTIAVALALLVCLALVLSLTQIQWLSGRAADVQVVADAAAISGEQVVRAYTLVADVLDACVLSLGVTGIFVLGAGLITCAVPGLAPAGLKIAESGTKILQARQEFAASCAQNLQRVEKTLPALIAADSFATVEANRQGSLNYLGLAIPFPQQSHSEFGLVDDLSGDELEDKAQRMGEVSDRAKEAKGALDEALQKGWRADCVDDPMCLRSRAATLAHLSAAQNPNYAHPEDWNFGVALNRARAYYAARAAQEAPDGDSVDAQANSAMRRAYYLYAQQMLSAARYGEQSDGSVVVDLPDLAHNTDETRATTLYSEVAWPVSQEGDRRVIHAWEGCPGIQGERAGTATLQEQESGAVDRCEVCRLTVGQMGRVASISSNSTNGFEYYWRIVVEASRQWSQAKNELKEAEDELKSLGEESVNVFSEALEKLKVPRPKLCPPGAWGAIAVVARGEVSSPAELSQVLVGEATLPAGVAIAAATLAPEEATNTENILARLFDGITQGEDGGIEGVLEGITSLWGRLLVAYGAASESLANVASSFFEGLDAVGMGAVASWLSERLSDVVELLGLQPADLRLKKPVLCHSQDVLTQDGSATSADIRRYIQAMPTEGSVTDVLQAFGQEVMSDLGDEPFTIAEIPIPGTSITIPLTIDLSRLGLL